MRRRRWCARKGLRRCWRACETKAAFAAGARRCRGSGSQGAWRRAVAGRFRLCHEKNNKGTIMKRVFDGCLWKREMLGQVAGTERLYASVVHVGAAEIRGLACRKVMPCRVLSGGCRCWSRAKGEGVLACGMGKAPLATGGGGRISQRGKPIKAKVHLGFWASDLGFSWLLGVEKARKSQEKPGKAKVPLRRCGKAVRHGRCAVRCSRAR